MADVSWNAVLRNRDDYPDSMMVELGGQPIALGDLRNVTVPKEDMTRVTQGWSERERQSQARIDQLQTQLAQALTVANDYETRARGAANDYEGSSTAIAPNGAVIDYERDPILAPLFLAAKSNAEQQRAMAANLERVEKMLQGLGTQLGQWPVMMAIDKIKASDPYGVDPQALVQQALQMRQGPPNLNDAYLLMTRDQREQAIRAEAEKTAIEKAKIELARGAVPHHPYGPPSTIRMPEPTYATMDEAEHAAIMDPEMLGILMGSA